MPWDQFEQHLAAVQERGLEWDTYEDMPRGNTPVGGVSLQYDVTSHESRLASREKLQRYNARVTFIVTR
jgi:hypothetical protein